MGRLLPQRRRRRREPQRRLIKTQTRGDQGHPRGGDSIRSQSEVIRAIVSDGCCQSTPPRRRRLRGSMAAAGRSSQPARAPPLPPPGLITIRGESGHSVGAQSATAAWTVMDSPPPPAAPRRRASARWPGQRRKERRHVSGKKGGVFRARKPAFPCGAAVPSRCRGGCCCAKRSESTRDPRLRRISTTRGGDGAVHLHEANKPVHACAVRKVRDRRDAMQVD